MAPAIAIAMRFLNKGARVRNTGTGPAQLTYLSSHLYIYIYLN